MPLINKKDVDGFTRYVDVNIAEEEILDFLPAANDILREQAKLGVRWPDSRDKERQLFARRIAEWLALASHGAKGGKSFGFTGGAL